MYNLFPNRYLIKFLSKLTEYQDDNKMTPGNIAIVLGPNLLWTHSEGYGRTVYKSPSHATQSRPGSREAARAMFAVNVSCGALC
jgi:hypothetical protein